MDQTKYNKIKENFNNFLANRVAEQEDTTSFEDEGQIAEEPVAGNPSWAPGSQLSPEQVSAIAAAAKQWYDEIRSYSYSANTQSQPMEANDETLHEKLIAIIEGKEDIQETKFTAPKRGNTSTKFTAPKKGSTGKKAFTAPKKH